MVGCAATVGKAKRLNCEQRRRPCIWCQTLAPVHGTRPSAAQTPTPHSLSGPKAAHGAAWLPPHQVSIPVQFAAFLSNPPWQAAVQNPPRNRPSLPFRPGGSALVDGQTAAHLCCTTERTSPALLRRPTASHPHTQHQHSADGRQRKMQGFFTSSSGPIAAERPCDDDLDPIDCDSLKAPCARSIPKVHRLWVQLMFEKRRDDAPSQLLTPAACGKG